ncbi:MAG: hypothetical protein U0905_05680 [Pirellulales bacterium]
MRILLENQLEREGWKESNYYSRSPWIRPISGYSPANRTNQRVDYGFHWIFTHREEKVVDMAQASGLLDSSESLPK